MSEEAQNHTAFVVDVYSNCIGQVVKLGSVNEAMSVSRSPHEMVAERSIARNWRHHAAVSFEWTLCSAHCTQTAAMSCSVFCTSSTLVLQQSRMTESHAL